MAKVVGIGSAAGWVAATAVLAWTLASGQALSAMNFALPATAIGLPLIDLAGALLVLSRRQPPSDRPSRATRKAMRRAQPASGHRSGTRAIFRRPLQYLLLPSARASLPGRLRGLLAAATWTTLVAVTWQLVAITQGAAGASDASVQGQQFAASIWMMHLIVWCHVACRQPSRRSPNSTVNG